MMGHMKKRSFLILIIILTLCACSMKSSKLFGVPIDALKNADSNIYLEYYIDMPISAQYRQYLDCEKSERIYHYLQELSEGEFELSTIKKGEEFYYIYADNAPKLAFNAEQLLILNNGEDKCYRATNSAQGKMHNLLNYINSDVISEARLSELKTKMYSYWLEREEKKGA